MPDSSSCRKKRKITIVASQKGVERAEKALIRLGFDSKINFAKSQLISRNVVSNFFNLQLIQVDTFKGICKALKLDWNEIVDLQDKDKQEGIEERQLEASLSVEGAKPVPVALITRKVIAIDEQGQEIKTATVILEGDISSVQADLLFFQDDFSKKYPGSTLKVISIKQGSIKLIIEGTQKDIEILLSDFESGNLTEIEGFPVKNVQLLSESSEDDESSEQKWRLVEEIVTNPIKGRDLSGADLSDADLSGANLSDADLSNSDLSGADLSGADLSNADLSNADLNKANLQDADLSRAKFVQTQLDETDLTGARLTGTIIEDWEITLDLYHNQGVDPRAIAISFKQLAENHPEAELEIVAMERRGQENFLVRAKTAPEADRSILSAEYFEYYNRLKALPKTDLIFLLAQKDGQVEVQSLEIAFRTVTQSLEAVPKTLEYYLNNAKFGGGFATEGGIQTGGNFNDFSSNQNLSEAATQIQQQNLAEGAAQIQQLLEQLDKSYPTNTIAERMVIAGEAIKQIEANPTLMARILGALKAFGISAFEQLIDHPAASFVIRALEGFQDTTETPDNNKEIKIDKKESRLVQEIRSQGARKRDLIGTDLSGAKLSNADLSGADLRGSHLNAADLSNTNLSDANLSGADLSGADLSNANLSSAKLRGVYLSSADLSEADLSFADLSDANVSGANLSGADLSGANVNSARFGNNPGISQPLKQDLIRRGAIFDDSPGDRSRSKVLVPR